MEVRGCGCPSWADTKELYRTGRDGWGTGVGKCLTCLPGRLRPAPGTSMPWSIGEGSIGASLRGFTGSHFCTGPDLAGGFGAVHILEVSLPHCLFVGQFGKFHQHSKCVNPLPQQFRFLDSLQLTYFDLRTWIYVQFCSLWCI